MVRFTFVPQRRDRVPLDPAPLPPRPRQTVAQLGQPAGRGGCPHSTDVASRHTRAGIGSRVVVLR